MRSGNTSNPEKEWSPWSGPYQSASGESVGCPPARFLQWKAVFQVADKRDAPQVSWVSIAYQPENVAPVVDDIAIQDPGVRVQGFSASPGGPATPASVQLKTPQRSGSANAFPNIGAMLDASSKSLKMDVPPQGFEEKGYQSVLWSAHDDNDDDLVFAVYYRGEGEQSWRLLKDKLAQRFYSWDSTTMPDGAYYLKIVASDLPSNPPNQALASERSSERFEIQNTPPRIENLRADTSGQAAKISFRSSKFRPRDHSRAVQRGCRRLADRFPRSGLVGRAKRKLSARTPEPRARPARDRRADFRPLRQHHRGASKFHRGSAAGQVIPAGNPSGQRASYPNCASPQCAQTGQWPRQSRSFHACPHSYPHAPPAHCSAHLPARALSTPWAA